MKKFKVTKIKCLFFCATLVFSVLGCSSSNSDLEVSLDISSSVLIPANTQSCSEVAAELATTGATPVYDIPTKFFTLKRPRLKWKATQQNIEILSITFTADKNNSCGMNFTCAIADTEMKYIFALPKLSTSAATTTTTLSGSLAVSDSTLGHDYRYQNILYGTATAENANCKTIYGNGPTTGITDPANDCNYRNGNDVCYVRCGGVSAAKENCKAKGTMTVIGVKTDSEHNQFPIRVSTPIEVENLFN